MFFFLSAQKAGCQMANPASIKLISLLHLIVLKLSKTQKFTNTAGHVCDCTQQGNKLHVYIRSVY